MKTKISISEEVFSGEVGNLPECYKYYDDNYKDKGFVLCKRSEDVFIIIDKEIILNEGDRIELYGFRIVDFKYVDILNDEIVYEVREE